MENEHTNDLHFHHKKYFLRFIPKDSEQLKSTSKSIRHALEYFVDDLKNDRNQTIDRFLNDETVREIFLCIAQLLSSDDERVCGNSAYILGSTVETDNGLERFLSVFSDPSSLKIVDIIQILSQLLVHSDSDCVLNATGTLGTICSSKDGREFLIKHACISQMILNVSTLLNSTNSWIASNAALVIARVTVEESGCQIILTHPKCHEILNCLLNALDKNDLSRSTNVAFAIARLIEGEDGKKVFIKHCGEERLLQTLLLMFEIDDIKGTNKNACYALSCLCANEYGYQLCCQSITLFHRILHTIEKILLSTEYETVWFALMCLTTIAKHSGANGHLCYSEHLLDIIRQIQERWTDSKDIQDESHLLWCMLHRSNKPNRPKLHECRDTSVDISWDPCAYSHENNPVEYRVLLDEIPITVTNQTNYVILNLEPNTKYHVKIQYVTKQGEGIPSDATIFHTNDQLPPPVVNLHLARTTMTAVRLAWEMPDLSACNSFKGYQVYLNEVEYELTSECGITISSLMVNTVYQIDVCVVTLKGRGPSTSISVKTDSAGECLPAPPTFSVIGRRELNIKWQPPEVIAGRFSRYELICNNRCIYSGTDQEYRASMLKSDKEYTVSVIAITNEGRFRSRPAKTRTLKDEFHNAQRHSLYEPPPQNASKLKRTDTFHVRKISPSNDRHASKEMLIPAQNVQITTVRSVEFKPEKPSYSRTLPGLFRNSQTRPSRSFQRLKTDVSSPTISAAIIIPTLDIHHTRRSKSYRHPVPTKTAERSSSVVLPDLPYGLQRTN